MSKQDPQLTKLNKEIAQLNKEIAQHQKAINILETAIKQANQLTTQNPKTKQKKTAKTISTTPPTA